MSCHHLDYLFHSILCLQYFRGNHLSHLDTKLERLLSLSSLPEMLSNVAPWCPPNSINSIPQSFFTQTNLLRHINPYTHPTQGHELDTTNSAKSTVLILLQVVYLVIMSKKHKQVLHFHLPFYHLLDKWYKLWYQNICQGQSHKRHQKITKQKYYKKERFACCTSSSYCTNISSDIFCLIQYPLQHRIASIPFQTIYWSIIIIFFKWFSPLIENVDKMHETDKHVMMLFKKSKFPSVAMEEVAMKKMISGSF